MPKQLNPYEQLPDTAFWKTAVAQPSPLDIQGLWQPKFAIRPNHRIITAGSCFAQHIGRALAKRGYHWLDAEPGPELLSNKNKRKFNYGVFSFRTGNIYTAKTLSQWINWAFGVTRPPTEVWETGERYYDPFRPAIEPNGFASIAEVSGSRSVTLDAIREAVEQADVFVFTLGLTESWYNVKGGFEYAMCPGTIAGRFDPKKHRFHNHSVSQIREDIESAFSVMRTHNRNIRLLLTVSPVPLTATASGEHVLTSTTHSKSILRAAAGELCANHDRIDYFPSYELITGSPFRAMFFEPNLRSVSPKGVSMVMENFFRDQTEKFGVVEKAKSPESIKRSTGNKRGRTKRKNKGRGRNMKNLADHIVCEEEMLSAFGK